MWFKETIEWYDSNAKNYSKAIEGIVSWRQVNNFLSLLPEQGEILDAGCNSGRDCRVFTKMGFKSVGLDLARNSLLIAKKTNIAIPFINANFLNLPLPDGHFDGLWVHASIHHLETTDEVIRAFAEFNRILKHSGIIHLATQAQTGNQKTAVVSDTLVNASRFYQFFTSSELIGLFNDSGFELVQINQHKEIDDKVSGKRENVEWLIALARKR